MQSLHLLCRRCLLSRRCLLQSLWLLFLLCSSASSAGGGAVAAAFGGVVSSAAGISSSLPPWLAANYKHSRNVNMHSCVKTDCHWVAGRHSRAIRRRSASLDAQQQMQHLGIPKKHFQPMQPRHQAQEGEHLGQPRNLRVQKHNWEIKLQTNAGKRLTDPLAGGGNRGLGGIIGPWLLQQKYC